MRQPTDFEVRILHRIGLFAKESLAIKNSLIIKNSAPRITLTVLTENFSAVVNALSLQTLRLSDSSL